MSSKAERTAHAIKRCKAILNPFGDKEVIGVEVGVYGAALSSTLLENFPQVKKLYGVDIYKEGFAGTLTQEKCDGLFDAVKAAMKQFGARWQLFRMDSLEAALFLPNGLDFVYLDSNHEKAHLIKEIYAYEKKVRDGGIIGGHDFDNLDYPGVSVAVQLYAEKFERKLRTDPETLMWYWVVDKTPKKVEKSKKVSRKKKGEKA